MSTPHNGSAAERIDELLDEIDITPIGPRERALIDQAITLADEAGDEERAYQARMRLTSSAHMTGDTDAMLAAFGWCVGKFDQDPVRFPNEVGGGNDLLFQYKWMAGRVASNPAFPLSQLDAIHADMSERYRRAGVSQSGVLQSRFSTAMDTGNLVAAGRFRDERELIPRDDYSHCEACVRAEDAAYFRLIGQEDTALALFDEIMEQGLTCGEEPESVEANSLLALLRAGRLDEARAVHLRSYRVARHSPDGLAMVADHLVFCAVTGNESRGLSILERLLRDLTVDPLNRMLIFSARVSLAVFLDSVTRAGAGSTPIRGAQNADLAALLGENLGEQPTAESLAAALWAGAEEIAAEFNARNGNTAFSDRIARARLLAGEHYDLPISAERFTPPSALERPEDAAPVTTADWLLRAQTAMFEEDRAAVLAAVDQGLAVQDGDAESRVRLYSCVIQTLIAAEQEEGARSALTERIAELRTSGHGEQADLEERFGLLMFSTATAEDEDSLLAELERARVAGAPTEVVLDLLFVIADLRMRTQRPAEALPIAIEALALAEQGPKRLLESARTLAAFTLLYTENAEGAATHLDALLDAEGAPHVRMQALRLRAQIHGMMGTPRAGIPLADELLARTARGTNRENTIQAAQLAANLLNDDERPGEAAARIEYAIDLAQRAESAQLIGLRFLLGRYQLNAGAFESATENLDEAYRAEEAAEAPPAARAETLFWLAQAAQGADENGLAYGAFSRAIELADEGEAAELSARAGILLGQLCNGFNDPEAIEILEAALANAQKTEDADLAAAARHRLGQTRANHGDEAGLADLDAVLEFARERGADWLIADVTDSRARALGSLGRNEEAIQAALTAADAYSDCGDEGNAAMSELFVARVLTQSGREEEAVSLYTASIERLPEGSPAFIGLNLELGALLEQLGRHAEAAAARARAEQ
ncbi:hypothetical protein D9V32_15265 [Mycetocola tolaasinivorans]|uniref:Tetratricopeptide repeat protein n=1 Tax=Mycetocola tolaasinivorans TaxID=76635 RepID=A0A3L6ZXD1_9MICO|nr:hypothetical protein [Mycetocola tolaasinivorans]RLP72683.1 hypothetical protein D9V32_15265 [Mycetocola tolaasinivorans]